MKKDKYLVSKISLISCIALTILLYMKWTFFSAMGSSMNLNGIEFLGSELKRYIIYYVGATILISIAPRLNKFLRIIFSIIGTVGFFSIALIFTTIYVGLMDSGLVNTLVLGYRFSAIIVAIQIVIGIKGTLEGFREI